METPIVNRVANSALQSIDLAEYLDNHENSEFDISQGLFQGLVLKEKEFRQFVKEFDWSQYQGKNVAVHCSADAIVPSWAYMLVASRLEPLAHLVVFGDQEDLEKQRVDQAITRLIEQDLTDAKVVIKGCGNLSNRDYAYFELAKRLTPVVSSLMYGEPCSTVPVYKRPRN
tara:strand:- start:251 stop:763 length:513 start_codon:yes stop_codon:yes gene_type:complete